LAQGGLARGLPRIFAFTVSNFSVSFVNADFRRELRRVLNRGEADLPGDSRTS
jgi:hypothetical protein